ncbi:TerB family tellurite resistance protein [Rhizobium sp. SSA_523]|uniref:tellurite resistance TerB family protein n=1 Tax=Rhizobium sp. SSA_523 TaxID=2952477 RepID=UPI002090D5AE|nr:TerB family tellurite resistance protein [Rhizobium sp. SSA_523]MCO5733568.1 TerB family tellurite resistance protein [Rhizobium sp. SSA_523]WKC23132.1 TerB family tellurite resistance protein [Rhizobium sp. SSA_523]
MFDRILDFFHDITGDRPTDMFAPDDPRVAFVALCFQVMEADGRVSEDEKARLHDLLRHRYALDKAHLASLIETGRTAGSEAVDYYRFTSDLKRHLDPDECVALVGVLWDLVYADGERSEMEDHVIWRIANLLGVSARDRVLERQKVAIRAGEAEPGSG